MTTDLLVGQQVANVRLERLLGQGDLGQVYAGLDLGLQQPVAVKVLKTPSHTQRFRDAARMVATWRHAHIIAVHHAGEQAGRGYVVMEYLEGQDLGSLQAEYRADGQLLPQEHVLLVGNAIASALDYAHRKGVIHRDVKPANVLISVDDRIVLTDFGLALDQQRGSAGNIFGSPHYIAPEQARSSAEAVPQSDLYALGVMLFELLTGRLPFEDPSPIGVAFKHMTAPPPAPRQLNPALNDETEAVLLKALRKNPGERYATGAALMQALATALATRPAHSLKSRDAAPRPAPPVSQPPADRLLGTALDCYRVEALLGQGGMARIYRGLDTRLQRTVAIKVIDTPYQHDPDYTMRFAREAQAIARLDHPNIVHLYYYGETNGLLYMVMQYVEGPDLQRVLAEQRAAGQHLAPARLLQLVRNICYALDYAHSQGVIHRDVHPGNILLDQRGRGILTDFGLALMTAVGTRGEIFGTPHYMAPEQAESSAKAVPQSDLYSVAVMLYELLTGRVPFDAPLPLDVALMHITQAPAPVRELNPAVSPALEAVIMRALAKHPRERYQTGAALAAAVAQALGGAANHA